MSKSIVIFFSHAGDNYSVGNIEVGNTKIVADYISEITGADQFEIVTRAISASDQGVVGRSLSENAGIESGSSVFPVSIPCNAET